MDIDFPFHFDSRGRTADTTYLDHIKDMVEQVLFTTPGERVNRPDFGSGLAQLVHETNSSELADSVQFTVRGALDRWLGDVIEVIALEVIRHDSTLQVNLQYRVRLTGEDDSMQTSFEQRAQA